MSNSNSNSNTIRVSSISAYAIIVWEEFWVCIICILRSSVPCPLSLSHTLFLSLSLSLSFFSLGFFSSFPRIIDFS